MCENKDKRTLSDEQVRDTVEETRELSCDKLKKVSGGAGSSSQSAKIKTGDTRETFSADPDYIRQSIFGSKF